MICVIEKIIMVNVLLILIVGCAAVDFMALKFIFNKCKNNIAIQRARLNIRQRTPEDR